MSDSRPTFTRTDLWRGAYNMLRSRYATRMEGATDNWEEIKKSPAVLGLSHDTFYIDYIGHLRQTDYSKKLTDVRFICKPPVGKTLHINVVDHGGKFRIDFLACGDVTAIVDAAERAFREHGLDVERKPEIHLTLPFTVWREGLEVPGADC